MADYIIDFLILKRISVPAFHDNILNVLLDLVTHSLFKIFAPTLISEMDL